MRETPEQIAELQRLLDESYETAGDHLRSVMTPDRRLTARQVAEALTGMTLLSLATVTARCEPIVSPVDGIFCLGKFWFGSGENSLRFRHIRTRPQVSATHTRGESLVVTVHGTAHEIEKSSGNYEGFREVLREVYPEFDSWGHWESAPYAYIEARRMFAASFDFDTPS